MINWIKKLITVKKSYTIVYYSRGFMGNKYIVGVYDFEMTRKQLKYNSPSSYSWKLHSKSVLRHYRLRGNNSYTITTAVIEND